MTDYLFKTHIDYHLLTSIYIYIVNTINTQKKPELYNLTTNFRLSKLFNIY